MTISLIRRRLLASSGALLFAGVMPARAQPAPEAPLLAQAIGPNVVLLNTGDNAVRGIMQRALDFGQVTAQTANALAVMERTGVAMRLEQEGSAASAGNGEAGRNIAGGYVGGDIDLRFNFDAWRYAFAVTEKRNDGSVSRSLQFFDAQGNAVHKLYARNEAAGGLFDQLAMDFRAAGQTPSLVTVTAPARIEEKPDSTIPLPAFHQAWLAMTDPGQFSAILAAFGATRRQAMRLAPPAMAQRLAPQALRALVDGIAQHKLPIVAYVGNAGVTQIYAGTLAQASGDGAAYMAQAPGFRLALRDSALRSGYLVQRAGAVSVEFYGEGAEPALTLVGRRDLARPLAWAELLQSLPRA
ncbi:hemin-degrading factor [Pseudoduganella ginsengisoli]|uniref:Hemin-degrading factor n=1 Tax=Pseudoduganella ginsengisoli TaxID=1462440 RepID=A0A6L6Q0D5_9BURK|nr:ChuX/HutX family heme-like substrate-binding protein [Pseudoduganella ginsengisoli]MTW02879.1 hemin-degrading factor [Pseudoduganella ginsengisoli]